MNQFKKVRDGRKSFKSRLHGILLKSHVLGYKGKDLLKGLPNFNSGGIKVGCEILQLVSSVTSAGTGMDSVFSTARKQHIVRLIS